MPHQGHVRRSFLENELNGMPQFVFFSTGYDCMWIVVELWTGSGAFVELLWQDRSIGVCALFRYPEHHLLNVQSRSIRRSFWIAGDPP
jgi:hypothetical protein